MGPNRDKKAKYSHNGYFGLHNTTEETIVAFHIFSNFQQDGAQKYNISPHQGFLLPKQTLCITVSRNVISQQELNILMKVEDLLFVKALPLHEKQVTRENLDEYRDPGIFHSFNIDLMFTLEAMTTEFVNEPVEKPSFDNSEFEELEQQNSLKMNTFERPDLEPPNSNTQPNRHSFGTNEPKEQEKELLSFSDEELEEVKQGMNLINILLAPATKQTNFSPERHLQNTVEVIN